MNQFKFTFGDDVVEQRRDEDVTPAPFVAVTEDAFIKQGIMGLSEVSDMIRHNHMPTKEQLRCLILYLNVLPKIQMSELPDPNYRVNSQCDWGTLSRYVFKAKKFVSPTDLFSKFMSECSQYEINRSTEDGKPVIKFMRGANLYSTWTFPTTNSTFIGYESMDFSNKCFDFPSNVDQESIQTALALIRVKGDGNLVGSDGDVTFSHNLRTDKGYINRRVTIKRIMPNYMGPNFASISDLLNSENFFKYCVEVAMAVQKKQAYFSVQINDGGANYPPKFCTYSAIIGQAYYEVAKTADLMYIRKIARGARVGTLLDLGFNKDSGGLFADDDCTLPYDSVVDKLGRTYEEIKKYDLVIVLGVVGGVNRNAMISAIINAKPAKLYLADINEFTFEGHSVAKHVIKSTRNVEELMVVAGFTKGMKTLIISDALDLQAQSTYNVVSQMIITVAGRYDTVKYVVKENFLESPLMNYRIVGHGRQHNGEVFITNIENAYFKVFKTYAAEIYNDFVTANFERGLPRPLVRNKYSWCPQRLTKVEVSVIAANYLESFNNTALQYLPDLVYPNELSVEQSKQLSIKRSAAEMREWVVDNEYAIVRPKVANIICKTLANIDSFYAVVLRYAGGQKNFSATINMTTDLCLRDFHVLLKNFVQRFEESLEQSRFLEQNLFDLKKPKKGTILMFDSAVADNYKDYVQTVANTYYVGDRHPLFNVFDKLAAVEKGIGGVIRPCKLLRGLHSLCLKDLQGFINLVGSRATVDSFVKLYGDILLCDINSVTHPLFKCNTDELVLAFWRDAFAPFIDNDAESNSSEVSSTRRNLGAIGNLTTNYNDNFTAHWVTVGQLPSVTHGTTSTPQYYNYNYSSPLSSDQLYVHNDLSLISDDQKKEDEESSSSSPSNDNA